MSQRTTGHRRPPFARPTGIPTRQAAERALLVGVAVRGKRQPWELRDSLEELTQLARTAGAEVAGTLSQQLPRLTRSYVGHGKLVEVQQKVRELGCTTVIVDDELTPTQQRNVEEALQADAALQAKVIDRTALIIDIFAQRARTQEGRLQVELAQSQYLLPRLVGQWSHLERLGGGIGTRGPGESQLETDRRLVTGRIQKLKERLEDVRRRRSQYRERRKNSGTPVAALVGYTNAGKSTLFNALSKSAVNAEDRLFSTLDPTTRQVLLPDRRPIFLSDTVGFINKLPPILVAAFRATLEELEGADLLLHVVDISHPNAAGQARVVDETLAELGLAEKPRLLVLNKLDLLMDEEAASAPDNLVLDGIQPSGAPPVGVSAARRWGLHRLLEAIAENCPRKNMGLPTGNALLSGFAPDNEGRSSGPARPTTSQRAPRPVPYVETLQEAVHKVIAEHHAVGDPAIHLIRATQGGHAADLVGACERLAKSKQAQTMTEATLKSTPSLLTLDDMIAVHGETWDLPGELIEQAHANARRYDGAVGFRRYEREDH